MDSSRRAVEAYWRSRMIDGVTADDDKVAPVYKLEEICDLLRTSHVSIVKEVSDYILKRLDSKSPIVKQKALRLIKYAVGKSGTEFRREMQRHSAAMRQLFHYKGEVDPLKGDALNKAVRDSAHEAVSAIFASDDSKPMATEESVHKRIEGFGNTNYEMPTEDKKSFLSEVVGFGSASIKQGLSTIAAHSMRKNDNGSYKSPNLRRSLTTEIDSGDRYVGEEHHRDSWASSGISRNVGSGRWSPDVRTSMTNTTANEENEDTSSSHREIKSREERLLETVVSSGGVRLQPTRDAIQAFLTEASKLDAVAMSHALEMKLKSHLWQVRMKALCVLESILRKKNEEYFSIIASYFSDNRFSVLSCSQFPQASLREKASKVSDLLGRDPSLEAEQSNEKAVPVPAVQMPDLIDTGDSDDYGSEASSQKPVDENIGNLLSPGPSVDDLLGSGPMASHSTSMNRSEDDPFADVSFHVTEDKQHDDIFSGMTLDDKRSNCELKTSAGAKTELADIFSSTNSEQLLLETENGKTNVHNLMAGLSLNGMAENKQSGVALSGSSFLDGGSQQRQLPVTGALNGIHGSNTFSPLAPTMQYSMPPNMMFNPGFATQAMDYGAMGAFIAQQQLLFQNLGNRGGYGHAAGIAMQGGYTTQPLPDVFQLSNNQVQSHSAVMTSSKKEETKAFDFISDHLTAARDSKRVL